MPTRATHLPATPEEVWAALAVRADGGGPVAPGGRRWPTARASVLESAPPRRLLLEAPLGPLATTRVELRLAHSGTGTDLVIDADARSGPLARPALRLAGRVLLAVRETRFLSRVRAGTPQRSRAVVAHRTTAVTGPS
ncbi:MAG TPA: hypothetical protein VFN50_11290 [Acidimicrobiales bacterium]|nr:hypothetical protein [Acidimicrobiales bacterium]